MNLSEARELVVKINAKNCGGRPMPVYDGDVTGHPYGDSKLSPDDSDPGTILCKLLVSHCIFAGGTTCPAGLKPGDV